MNPSSSRASRRFQLIAISLLVLLLVGCGSKGDIDDGRTADELYVEAKAAITKGNYSKAAQIYAQLQSRYPFGRYTEQAQLEMAYAQYKLNQPEQAIASLDRFVKTYPAHPNIDYAYYLKGLINYEENYGFMAKLFPSRVRDRDQTIARQSFNDFNELLRRFPDSQYAPDARQRMVYLRNNLAAYEIEVAKYYMRRTAYIAASNRARYVLETYPGTPETSTALQILHESYVNLDMPELAESTLEVLTLNFPDDAYITGYKKGDSWLSKLWPFD